MQWEDLVARMLTARGRYNEERLTPERLMEQCKNGRSVVRRDTSGRIIAHITLWPMDSQWEEAGSLYVENSGNGIGKEILQELIAKKKSPQKRLVYIASDQQAVGVAINNRFH